jgi:WD40 repeat protein
VTDRELRGCLDHAYGRMANASVGLLYYSGHGIQIDDRNYLVTTDARTRNLKTGFVPVQPIVSEIQHRAAATLVVLDACRTNPLAPRGRPGLSDTLGRAIKVVADTSSPPGAASPQVRGLMVAYSTSPNAVALDGSGELSPFTEAFVRVIDEPGFSIQRVMSEVTKAVGDETSWAQTPWMKSSLTSELKLDGEQTLEQAQSISNNWANTSQKLLWTSFGRKAALTAALKGLPAHPSEAVLKLFPQAYLAVYSAMQTHMTTLPVKGWPEGDISSDFVAVVRHLDDGGSGLELWSRSRQTLLRSLSVFPGTHAFSARFSPDGATLVASGFGDGRIIGWDVASGAKLYETVVAHEPVGGLLGDKKMIYALSFSPDGKFLVVTASDKNLVQILDVRTARPVQSLQNRDFTGLPEMDGVTAAIFLGKTKLCLVLGSNKKPSDWAIGTYDLQRHVFQVVDRLSTRGAMFPNCDPAGRYVALTLLQNDNSPTFTVWDVQSGRKLLSTAGAVTSAAFDPNAPFVAASTGIDTKIYDLSTGEEIHPADIPEGFRAGPDAVVSSTGIPVSLTAMVKPWFSWDMPVGPALIEKALSLLSAEEQAEVASQRISFRGD